MKSFFRMLATIGVSEFVLIFLLVLALGGVFAMSSANVNFQLTILPPPPPIITSILGDSQTRAVLVLGSTTLPESKQRVYAFSDPLVVETTANEEGIFFSVFTADVLPPGQHEFSAATVLTENQTTDSSSKVAVTVQDDYTVRLTEGATMSTVKIGNADAATRELIRSIIRNQELAKTTTSAEIPKENTRATRARVIQLALLLIIVLETVVLLRQRAKRKAQDGRSFFHLGKGFYPIHKASAGHRPTR